MPGYDAFNDLVNAVDPVALAAALNRWLLTNSDLLPKTLAMDGKDLGGKSTLGAIITLCHHRTGAPLAELDPLVSRKEKRRSLQKRNPLLHYQLERGPCEPRTACRRRALPGGRTMSDARHRWIVPPVAAGGHR